MAVSLVLVFSSIALLGSLLMLYAGFGPLVALVDAGSFMGLLAVCGMLSWFFFAYIRVWQAQIVLTLLVQGICLGISYTIVSLAELESADRFGWMIPLRLLFGLSCWMLWMQSYRIRLIKGEYREKEKEESLPAKTLPPLPALSREDGRISVKDGLRIHLVPLDELLYIQASGDYVTLFTATRQYVKEQTMKYFDTHLPPSIFVRIHRSTIVNSHHILRVELFGKESYCVKLKNGTSLRASNSGYKLLRERLGL
jgi:hypothetical protein